MHREGEISTSTLHLESSSYSLTAACGMYVWPCWLCSDSGKVAQGLLASDQTKSVLPSDCPHVACQGSYLQNLISKAGYLPRIQLSSGFQPIWPEGTSVPLIELTPASHKALLRDEVDKNDAPSLRGTRTLKENVSANYIYSPFGQKTPKPPAYIPNRASNFEHYCYILSTFQPVVHQLSRQPLYSLPPTFPSIVNLIPQWLEDKELTWSHIPDAASR